jgi:hypothetical protein
MPSDSDNVYGSGKLGREKRFAKARITLREVIRQGLGTWSAGVSPALSGEAANIPFRSHKARFTRAYGARAGGTPALPVNWSAGGSPALSGAAANIPFRSQAMFYSRLRRSGRRDACAPRDYSVELATALERAFQINGSVPQVWPRCCGRKPKSTTRPFPTLTSASAI